MLILMDVAEARIEMNLTGPEIEIDLIELPIEIDLDQPLIIAGIL